MKRIVVGILAHVDAGKTTLSEALLYKYGAVRVLGAVDEKSSHLDHHALERSRGITIYSKQACLTCGDVEVTLLDTPGHVDFSTEAERTLSVLDCAILLVDSNEGVRGHTETLWRLLERYEIPTLVFANKFDLTHKTRDELMDELHVRLSVSCVDHEGGQDAIESCAMCDERALDEFLETGGLSSSTLVQLVRERKVFPSFFGSALKQEGIDELVRGVCELAHDYAGEEETEFGARVFKISHDERGARLSWVKVTSGVLEVKHRIEGSDEAGAWSSKVDQIRTYLGPKFEPVKRLEVGQVGALTGLERTQAGMSLGCEAGTGDSTPVLVPVMSSSVILGENDVHKVHAALRLLTDEDPQLAVRWDERLAELQVRLMGEIQLEVLRSTLAERFGLDVDFGPGGVLYRETIAEPVVGIGHFEPLRHYAEVQLLLEPLERGSGVEFGTRCHVDDLDLNWQRLILTNAMEREHLGVLVGAPIEDVRITLLGGRAHDAHTEGGDFRQATYRAIRQGLMQAKSVLLEPWYRFSLRVPADQVGRALADLQKMAAHSQAPKLEGDFSLIEGAAPASEMRDYALRVAAYSHGLGSLSLEYAGYEPCHNADSVIERAAYDPEADLANTPDSVFCSHGAGHTVKWNEVPERAHVHIDKARLVDWREATPDFFAR